MKKIISLLVLALFTIPAVAATQNSQARRSMASQMVMSAPRATASTNQISAMASLSNPVSVSTSDTSDKSSVRVPVDDNFDKDENTNDESDDNNNEEYEKLKQACINNNIGMGNTFVWASRYSSTTNYASMVEDVNNPENNVCFVLVSVKSNDPKISVSDVPEKYFQMGQNITCGSWADENVLRQRILDAKKSARTWATVGGAVGGAGVGVGVMELFGNRLIGGRVMGQKDEDLTKEQQMLWQLRALKQQDTAQFDQAMKALETLKEQCEGWKWGDKPSECSQYDFNYLLNAKN